MKFRHGKIPLFLFFLYLYFYLLLADFLLFWAKTGYLLPCAALYTHFSESKSGNMLCVWLSVDYFGLKRIIHFHLQPYSPTFRNRKDCTLKSVNKRFSRLNRRRESVAFSPHIKLSSAKFFHASEILYLRSQTLRAARYGGSVRSQTQFGTSVTFYILRQSTGLTFLPSLPTAR